MDCSRFQSELVELLAADDVRGRDGRVREIRLHAAACAACGGSKDLLGWATLEPAERDGGAEPGEAYWAQFNERLHRRIAAETGGRRTRPVAILAAAAAVVAAALLGGWILRPDPVAVATGNGPARGGEKEPLLVAGVNDVEGILGAFDGWDGFDLDAVGDDPLWVESEDALFPHTADLDADTRRLLLEWLGEQASRLDGGPA